MAQFGFHVGAHGDTVTITVQESADHPAVQFALTFSELSEFMATMDAGISLMKANIHKNPEHQEAQKLAIIDRARRAEKYEVARDVRNDDVVLYFQRMRAAPVAVRLSHAQAQWLGAELSKPPPGRYAKH